MTDLTYLDEHRAIIGASGSGKTVTAKHQVEQLLGQGRHTCVTDHTGVWYGLRSDAAGTGPGFDIPIFGGRRGDVAIGADDGDAIGRIVADGVSAIVDLSALRTGSEQRIFMADFVAALRRKAPGHFQFVADEADEDVPEKPRDDVGFRLVEDMVWIAKRGRSDGFVLTLITQRPASIAKEALSQAQAIFVHQLTAPTDKAAIGGYIKDQGTAAAFREIMGKLPGLQQGERYLYAPKRGLLELGRTPLPTTFDSSRTPGPGETRREPRLLAHLDLTAITAALARPHEDQAKAAHDAGTGGGELLVERDLRIAELEERNAWLEAEYERRGQLIRYWDVAISSAKAALDGAPTAESAPHLTSVQPFKPAPAAIPVDVSDFAARAKTISGATIKVGDPPDSSADLGAERKPLAYLAGVAPAGMTEADWSGLSGFKRKGGTWGTYKSRLRVAGLIEQRGDLWHATDAGVAAIGAHTVALPPPGPARAALWGERIPGVSRMLGVLTKRFPHFTTREALAADLNMAGGGGTFGTYLSRLRANGLLQEKGKRIRLSANVMGDA